MTLPKIEADKVCAIVVTFHPDTSFSKYLEEIRRRFASTFIVDNGSKGISHDMLRNLADANNIHLIEMGSNTGLGKALNRGMREAASNGYRWAVLFDQDTEPLGDMLGHFSRIFSEYPSPEKIAFIGSRFRDRNKNADSPDATETTGSNTDDVRGWVEKRRVITSGSLVPVDAYQAIGPFREDLFIDSIDHEYCYRARSKGWSVLQSTATLVTHTVGNYKKHRFLGFDIWRSHHSAMRCYFMARNKMLLAGERGEYGKFLRGGMDAIKNSVLVLMFEEDKLAKIRATLSGYIDGIRNQRSMPNWITRSLE